MDPVIRCTTLPSHSRSLKGFLFHFSQRAIHFYRPPHSELDDIEKVPIVTNRFTLIVLSALRRSDKENWSVLTDPEAQVKNGDGDTSFHFRNSDEYNHDPEKCEHDGPKVTTSHGGNTATRMNWRFNVADDLKECSMIISKDKSKEQCSKITTCCTMKSMNEESKTTS
ncbi:hypothetical protein Tco_0673076 [Tanacetum coccineum]